MPKWLALAVGVALLMGAMPVQGQGTDAADRAAAGVKALQGWYDAETGLYETTGWWNSANALHAVIDYMVFSGDRPYLDVVENTFTANAAGNFINDYYDDQGWWALTWLRAYDLTGDEKYRDMAETIFADMETGWDDVCGGGTWWNKDRQYKNAIANELYLQVAARLYEATAKPEYREWAERAWAWFDGSGMINTLNLVNDGLRDCANNGDITWTYNQGVILGGLVALARITGDTTLLERAEAIADATLEQLVDEETGILREPCELSFNCGNDGPQFKGIFMRNLYTLYTATQNPAYCEFIEKNAAAIWENRGPDDHFGLRWYGRFDRSDAARHSSAQEALNAALACRLDGCC